MTSISSVAGPSSLKDNENEKEKEMGYPVLSRGRRPSPPARQLSYSKRHASFDSPREVPLPSPSLHIQGGQVEYSYFDIPKSPRSPRKSHQKEQKENDMFTPVFEEDFEGSEWTSVDKQVLPALQLSSTKGIPTLPHTGSAASHLYETHSPLGMLPGGSQQIHPFPRPYSLPHSSTSSGSAASGTSPGTSGTDRETLNPPRLGRSKTDDGPSPSLDIYNNNDHLTLGNHNRDVDRSSSASLPLPTQIPYHTLPKIGEPHKSDVGRLRGVVGEVARSKVPESSAEEGESTHSSSGSSSSSTLPSTRSSSPPKTPYPPPFRSPAPPSSGAQNNPNMPNVHAFHSRPPKASQSRPSSTFSNDDSLQPLADHPTALRRRPPSSSSTGAYPPPEPPTILPQPSPPPNMGLMYSPSLSRPMTSNSETASSPDPPPIPKITNPSDLPPVLPPSRTRRSVPSNFLTSELAGPSTSSSEPSVSSYLQSGATNLNSSTSSAPGALASAGTSSPNSISAPPPYAPFLSPMPPPADSWIEVETTPAEYRLNIRLPGFKRDGITLATKRRRILHVVADSWPDSDPSPSSNGNSNGEPPTPRTGGHFERRISFGYDADLVGVRAEFDGDMLKIVVPRRQGLGGGGPFF